MAGGSANGSQKVKTLISDKQARPCLVRTNSFGQLHHTPPTVRIPTMPILVTAFGPFGGRKENASSLALFKLRKLLPGIRSRILPVDSVLAPARLKEAIRRIKPSALIMLGEAAGSLEIRLETKAWNEKSFDIPDIAGREPKGLPVRRNAEPYLSSTLPLELIHDRLIGLGHEVAYSENPGRYLCNQLFFSALDFLATNSIHIPAGFIHLPLKRDCPTGTTANAIAEAIRLTLSTGTKTGSKQSIKTG